MFSGEGALVSDMSDPTPGPSRPRSGEGAAASFRRHHPYHGRSRSSKSQGGDRRISFFGSHKWTISNYRAAAEYMDRSKATLSSDIFHLSGRALDTCYNLARVAAKKIPFQMKAWVDGRGDLCLRLFCGWRREEEEEEDKEKEEKEDLSIPALEDMLHASYSFSIEVTQGKGRPPVLRESSMTFKDRLSSCAQEEELQPMDSCYRSYSADTNGRTTDIDDDLCVNLDIKINIPVRKREGSRAKCGGAATLEKLFQTKRFSDVTLVAAGGNRFEAHKLLLSARSSVFAIMFSHPEMLENTTNEVCLEDTEPVVVERMLQYIYTDEFDVRVRPV